jgi:hypothetical protein
MGAAMGAAGSATKLGVTWIHGGGGVQLVLGWIHGGEQPQELALMHLVTAVVKRK